MWDVGCGMGICYQPSRSTQPGHLFSSGHNWLDFGGHPGHGADIGTFEGIFTVAVYGQLWIVPEAGSATLAEFGSLRMLLF